MVEKNNNSNRSARRNAEVQQTTTAGSKQGRSIGVHPGAKMTFFSLVHCAPHTSEMTAK